MQLSHREDPGKEIEVRDVDHLPSDSMYEAVLVTKASFGVCGRLAVASSALDASSIATAP
jgi:hypothetical protein